VEGGCGRVIVKHSLRADEVDRDGEWEDGKRSWPRSHAQDVGV
jgi:hypothetical protein